MAVSKRTTDQFIALAGRIREGLGTIKMLITNNAKEFNGEKIQDWCRANGIKHIGQPLIIIIPMERLKDLLEQLEKAFKSRRKGAT